MMMATMRYVYAASYVPMSQSLELAFTLYT
jgi:hypothetical protein